MVRTSVGASPARTEPPCTCRSAPGPGELCWAVARALVLVVSRCIREAVKLSMTHRAYKKRNANARYLGVKMAASEFFVNKISNLRRRHAHLQHNQVLTSLSRSDSSSDYKSHMGVPQHKHAPRLRGLESLAAAWWGDGGESLRQSITDTAQITQPPPGRRVHERPDLLDQLHRQLRRSLRCP